jgi:hypothetical protein
VLVKAQQIVGEAHTQERTLGGVEVLHAEAVALQVVFECGYSTQPFYHMACSQTMPYPTSVFGFKLPKQV